MDTFLLPDFLSCLRYSILAERSFICLNRKNNESRSSTNGTPILESTNHSAEWKDSVDEAFAAHVKKMIEKHVGGTRFLKRVQVLTAINEETLKQQTQDFSENDSTAVASSSIPYSPKDIPNSSTGIHNNESKVTKNIKPFEIFIIPNINDLDNSEQRALAKCMRNFNLTNVRRIFIGILQWEAYKPENTNDEMKARLAYQEILESPIKISDWLRNKFWMACHSPTVDLSESSLSSGYYSENESTPDESISDDTMRSEYLSNWLTLPQIHMESSLQRYLLDILVHLRLHRITYHAKGAGAHSNSVKDVIILSKIISLDSNKMFVTPRELKQAINWYYPMHVIVINHVSMDTSILYGSKVDLIEEFLNKVGKIKEIKSEEFENPFFIETLVIKDVISKVVPPV